MARNPRTANGSRYRRLRKQVLASDDTCCLCGGHIDRSLKSPHPLSATVEHLQPISRGGKVYDRANLGVAHRICNLRRGNKLLSVHSGRKANCCENSEQPIRTSREW